MPRRSYLSVASGSDALKEVVQTHQDARLLATLLDAAREGLEARIKRGDAALKKEIARPSEDRTQTLVRGLAEARSVLHLAEVLEGLFRALLTEQPRRTVADWLLPALDAAQTRSDPLPELADDMPCETVRVRVGCGMNLSGCTQTGVLDVVLPRGLTEEQRAAWIEQDVHEWGIEQFEIWHELIKS
jgi:hypothetical protein